MNTNITDAQIQIEQQAYLPKVFGWMCIGLITTGLVALTVVQYNMYINPILFFMAILLEFFLVYRISRYVMQVSLTMAMGMFIGFSALNGFTLSGLFYVYTSESLTSTIINQQKYSMKKLLH